MCQITDANSKFVEMTLENGKVIRLSPVPVGEEICIQLVNKNGTRVNNGFIACFTTGGTLKLDSNVNREGGLSLDIAGRIRIG